MARLITGRFDDIHQVERAVTALADAGLDREDYGVFYVGPPGQHHRFPLGGDSLHDAGTTESGTGAATGAALGGGAGIALGALAAAALPVAGLAALFAGAGMGAYVGSLMGAMSRTRDAPPEDGTIEHPVEQPGGVRIAVNVDRADAGLARQALETADAKDIVIAEGIWHAGDWTDYDPRVPPVTDSPGQRGNIVE